MSQDRERRRSMGRMVGMVIALLVVVGVIVHLRISAPPPAVLFPATERSFREGYEQAIKASRYGDRAYKFVSANVTLERTDGNFEVSRIEYRFDHRDRMSVVVVDFDQRRAWEELECSSKLPTGSAELPDWANAPVALDDVKVHIADVIAAAKPAGLTGFLEKAGKDVTFDLILGNTKDGPAWQLSAVGSSGPGRIEEIALAICSRTGAVKKEETKGLDVPSGGANEGPE